MITIYGIKNCDSVKKAFQFFNDHSLEYTFVDFKTSPVDKNKITPMVSKSRISTSAQYERDDLSNLGLKIARLWTIAIKVEWMAKENRLIKRPVIEYNSNVTVGFNLSQYEGIFLS